MHLAKYRFAKRAVAEILAKCSEGILTAEQAAVDILTTIAPSLEKAKGMEHYVSSAKGWLTQVLIAESRLCIGLLTERLNALAEISPDIRAVLGGISGRLRMISRV